MRKIEQAHGIAPIIYATNDSYDEYLTGLINNKNIWIRDILKRPGLPDGRRWTLWQYANNGRVDGITGLVDLNVFNGSQEDFRSLLER
jgi:lysozyme